MRFSVSTLVVALISSSVVMTDVFAVPLRPVAGAWPRSVAKRQVTVDATMLEDIAQEISASLGAIQGLYAIASGLTATLQELQSQLGLDDSDDSSDDSGDGSSDDPSGSTDGSDDSGADDGTGNENSD